MDEKTAVPFNEMSVLAKAELDFERRAHIVRTKYFKHIENKKTYYVSNIAKMKHPVTREWHWCVIYSSCNAKIKDNLFVREMDDFMEKFEPFRTQKLGSFGTIG